MNSESYPAVEWREGELSPRHLAHRAFDQLWESKEGMSEDERRLLLAKSHAYRLLKLELGWNEEKQGELDLRILKMPLLGRVPAAVARIKLMLAARDEAQVDADYRLRGEEISAKRKGY